MPMKSGIVSLFSLGCLSVFAVHVLAGDGKKEEKPDPRLTLDRIFDSDEFNTKGAGDYQWRKRFSGYTRLEEPEDGKQGKDLVWHRPGSKEKEVLVPANVFIPPDESNPLPIEDYQFSEDESKLLIYTNSKKVWRAKTRGDYWVLDIAARMLRQLGGDIPPASMQFASFSPDGQKVAYVRQNDLYVQDLQSMEIIRLTHDGSDRVINGTFDWVYEEEFRLRNGYRWSPDSRSIAFWQINTKGVKRFALINNTDGLYPEITRFAYPKTGQRNPAARIGVVPVEGGEVTWVHLPGDPREHYIARMDWAGNPEELLVQQFNRLQNTNRVYLADAESGKAEVILTETDEAWVEDFNPVQWIDDGDAFVWLSERSGWRHAYRVDRKGKSFRPITQGTFDVMNVTAVDTNRHWLYFTGSREDPTQQYLYRVRLKGGEPERVTPEDQPGYHGYNISPDGRWAMHSYSRFDRPPVHELVRLPRHKRIRLLENNGEVREKLEALHRPESEFFRVEIEENVVLDGWCIKPPEFDSDETYPVLFYVYGEPAGQTVLDRWGGKWRLWHWMLAQQGYLVMSVDNRGTPAPRGRDWRKSIYRKVGILNSSDQAAAVRALLDERDDMDPDRIAVWGWSGGGSMTLNLLFRYPDLYQTGMSIAPVPNQRLYDTIYQERYMGLPEGNPKGYRRGSPITYAHQLEGNLLLVHGTGDDNVHYQGTETLINELVAHKKQFSLMVYPNRSHSISEGQNTRRHLFGLLTQYLKEHVPPGNETE